MYLVLAVILALPIVIAAVVYTRHLRRVRNKPCPGPNGLPIIGIMYDAYKSRNDPFKYLTSLQEDYGTEIYLFNLFTDGVFFLQPEDYKHILYTNNKNYTRKGLNKNKYWFKWLGSGIFNAWGENWREQRKTARPLFHKLVLREMMPQFKENASVVIDMLEEHVKSGKAIDIQDLYFRYTLDTFGKLGFGEELNALLEKPEFAECFDKTQELITASFRNPFFAFTSQPNEFDKCIAKIEDTVYSFIRKRRELPREELLKRTDLLSRFMCLRDDNGEPYSDKYLRDIFMNFLIAGRDTTAVLMSWVTYLLCKNPEKFDELVEEIDAMFPDLQEPNDKEYTNMPKLRNVIQETLRLYPPVPFNGRFAIEDDVLPSGVKLKAGMRARIGPYLTHRDPNYWDKPLEFLPERWDDPQLLKHPFQFIPFHAGPQICLGKGLALMEAKTLLIMLFQRFKFSLDPTHTVRPIPKIITLSKTGIKVHVQRRV